MKTQMRYDLWRVLLSGILLAASTLPAWALQSMDDDQLSGVGGGGLAFVLENISAQMGPQSYIHSIGSAPSGGSTLQPGDLYWFGWSITGAGGSGTQWAPSASGTPNTCTTGGVPGDLACAVGSNSIANMAAFDNPYVLRVFPYSAVDENNNTNVSNTVLEFIAPSCVGLAANASSAPALGCGSSTQTPSDAYRWSFWGDIVVTPVGGATASTFGQLKSQTIIEGVPAAYFYPPIAATTSGAAGRPNMYQGAVMRLFRTIPDTVAPGNSDNATLGLNYFSALSGDFRFSVGQTGTNADTCAASPCTTAEIGVVPNFDNQEGLYFRNVQAFLPMGRLHYQSLVLGQVGTVAAPNGNFYIELTQVPDQANAYTDLYALEGGDTTGGYQTAHDAQCTVTGGIACTTNWTAVPVNYFQTHGYVQWGNGVTSTYQRTFMTNNLGGGGNNDQGDFGSRPYSPSSACASGPRTTACYTDTTDGISMTAVTGQTFTAAASTTDPGCSGSGLCAVTSYSSASMTSVNLGTANVQGLLLQHLKITTLGAN